MRALAALLLTVGTLSGWTESLTSPDFKGYLSGKGFAKGDAVIVEIDASSKLAFSASSTDSRTFTLEFSGGEVGNLFSFLPQGRTGGNQSVSGKQELSLRGRVAALVTEIDASGRGLVRGARSLEIEGRKESIEVSGWVDPRDVDQQRKVSFTLLGDARLVYRTLLSSSKDVLSAADIQDVLVALAQPAAGTSATVQPATIEPATAQPATAVAASTQPTTALSLTEAKKRELLLIYLNRLVDLVFGE